jgi:uncharacterized protein YjbI with pentapeptide repeats/menaquinone-dependent protoporphyrinogen IX oxidase
MNEKTKRQILVAYASVSGSTGEVAEAIGAELRTGKFQVSVKSVADITDIKDYSAIILGSSIRAGRWLPDAIRFLESHQQKMRNIPVAYFTTCLTMINDTQENRQIVLSYLEPVLELAPDIQPVGLGLFAGSLSPNMQAIVPGKKPYGDFREWDKIQNWARKILPALYETEARPAAPIVLSESILSFTDISDADLMEMDLHGSELHGAKLRRTKLKGADLRKTDLTDADLQEADLREASLGWADLNRSNLSGSNLKKANLIGSELKYANLSQANLNRANLNGANLSHSNLRGASLKNADLNWAILNGANLSKANLTRANLGWADLTNANLSKANLKEARYNEHTKWPTDFSPEEVGCVFVMSPH